MVVLCLPTLYSIHVPIPFMWKKNPENKFMQYKIQSPTTLNTKITLPASKSISNRALIINALAGGEIIPENLSDCDDTDVVLAAFRDMPYEIDIKAAGTAMRFLTAYLSVTEGEHVITGTERMKHRPIAILVESLRKLGADITYIGEEGFPPLKIRGKKLQGGQLEIAGNVSSQYISAMLMIGAVMENGLRLKLRGEIISRSYIELTLSMMREYGAEAQWIGDDVIEVKPGGYKGRAYHVENDWSASSYWYEMLAIDDSEEARVVLTGLMSNSRQGDSIVKHIYSLLGVKTTFISKEAGEPSEVAMKCTGRKVQTMEFDFSTCPDLAQTVVCTCLAMNIPFHFKGLSTLKIKETDRIEALKAEARKLGFVLRDYYNSELAWDGERCEATMEAIDTYEDHRMAMAFAPMAKVFPGLKINNPEVVSKSYPRYWEDLKKAGYGIEESIDSKY